jgi:SAM-dependent methyltransferase
VKCRACSADLSIKMIDLGAAPPSNAFNASQNAPEQHYPLRVLVCMSCGLAQTDISLFKLDHDQLFTREYPYHSSTSVEYVEHARAYVEKMESSLNLNHESLTVEVGSNDGYLLQWMTTPCVGIEPTATCEHSRVPIRTYQAFFEEALARRLAQQIGHADLMVCNNVLAHVPAINDFVRGFATLLKPSGVATFEFPHLLRTIEDGLFDQVYAEHYSMLSLTAVTNIFKANGLLVYDVEKISTHGGSLRVYAQQARGSRQIEPTVAQVIHEERKLSDERTYADFQERADNTKNDLLFFLLQARRVNRTVVGFGAAAKANTLLNYAGIRSDLIKYIVDETPAKRGKFCPGSRIPVISNFVGKPDYIVVFPYNWRSEIIAKLAPLGIPLVFAIPKLEVVRSETVRAAA